MIRQEIAEAIGKSQKALENEDPSFAEYELDVAPEPSSNEEVIALREQRRKVAHYAHQFLGVSNPVSVQEGSTVTITVAAGLFFNEM